MATTPHSPKQSPEPEESESQTLAQQIKKRNFVLEYGLVIFICSAFILVFSLIMAGISSFRNDITNSTYEDTSLIYNGPIEQQAPGLATPDPASDFYRTNYLSPEIVRASIDNTALTKTNAKVIITADFVKKGLVYQPAYSTNFDASYTLTNVSNTDSYVTFAFPFPANIVNGEISNARLLVNGQLIPDAKARVATTNYGSTAGLRWDGKLAPNSENVVEVSYETVGLSRFSYAGIENTKKSQDLNFEVTINGTRAYNVNGGLSVDSREFGANYVKLVWDKQNLYSTPSIDISVGDKLNPSTQVSRTYFTMAPVYAVFMSILVYLAYKFSRRLGIFDVVILSILFILYFPLIHYLSSFTIDPTMEIFSGLSNVGQFSMPLYGAFGIALLLIGGLMFYFLGRISGFKFAARLGIPSMLLFLGFFPLVVTIPEYSILLVIFGIIGLMTIILQTRVKAIKHNPQAALT